MRLEGEDSSGRPRPVKIEGSEFEILCDTIIPALGQKIDVDFMENDLLKTEKPGYQTQIEDIFIGGDAKRNAATAIIAISDGRRTAEEIMKKTDLDIDIPHIKNDKKITKRELMLKKAKRLSAPEISETDLDDRQNFKLVSKTLDEDTIIEEASRCLYCDEICNICTTVCPNFANYSYDIEPIKYNLKKVIFNKNGGYALLADGIFEVNQKYQILNIANFCNECGNCNTFCPTNSAPYKEKPKAHLTKVSFDNAPEGYFMDKSKQTLYFKSEDSFASLTDVNDRYIFESNGTIVSIDREFNILEVAGNMNKEEFTLHEAAKMSVVMKGIMIL